MMSSGYTWPSWVVVDVSEVGGPIAFIATQPGTSGGLAFSGAHLSGLTTRGSVERLLMRDYGLERPATAAEQEAARFGCIFGWGHPLARPDRHETQRT